MSCAESFLQTKQSTAWPAWPPTLALTQYLGPWTTCPFLRLCTERATCELSVSRPDWDHHQPTCSTHCHILSLDPHHHLSPHIPLLLCPFFVRLWPYYFYFFRPCFLSPPSPRHPTLSNLLSAPSHSVSVVFASMQQLSRFTKTERENIVCFCFYFLVICFFFIKWIKLTYFIILNKKVFFFTWLKIRDENCNKEKSI